MANQNSYIFNQENAFENVVREMANSSSRPQYDKEYNIATTLYGIR